MEKQPKLAESVRTQQELILKEWLALQLAATTLRRDLMKESELRDHSREFLSLFTKALEGSAEIGDVSWKPVLDFLAQTARSWVRQGFTSSETATFVFSLKQPMFDVIRAHMKDAKDLAGALWTVTTLLDGLGLQVMEFHQQNREEVIRRQQEELLEFSTPVVQLFDNILALPLIGTLDSARTQIVMENLLQRIVETGADDRHHRHHRSADGGYAGRATPPENCRRRRLMGADCIISGIRPQIAQTIVHLGR